MMEAPLHHDAMPSPTATVEVPAVVEEEDDAFYYEVLREMRARKLEENSHFQLTGGGTSKSQLQASETTDLTSSMTSFLSWAQTSNGASNANNNNASMNESGMSLSLSQHSATDEKQYWRELRQGKAPLYTDKQRNSSQSDLGASLPDLLAKLTRSSLQQEVVDYGKHTEGVKAYQYTQADLQQLAFEGRDFIKLQQSLRKQGAVTNSLLKQVLPMVILQSQKRRKARQKREQAKMDQILEMEASNHSHSLTGGNGSSHHHNHRSTSTTRSPPRSKSPVPFLSQKLSSAFQDSVGNLDQSQQQRSSMGSSTSSIGGGVKEDFMSSPSPHSSSVNCTTTAKEIPFFMPHDFSSPSPRSSTSMKEEENNNNSDADVPEFFLPKDITPTKTAPPKELPVDLPVDVPFFMPKEFTAPISKAKATIDLGTPRQKKKLSSL